MFWWSFWVPDTYVANLFGWEDKDPGPFGCLVIMRSNRSQNRFFEPINLSFWADFSAMISNMFFCLQYLFMWNYFWFQIFLNGLVWKKNTHDFSGLWNTNPDSLPWPMSWVAYWWKKKPTIFVGKNAKKKWRRNEGVLRRWWCENL